MRIKDTDFNRAIFWSYHPEDDVPDSIMIEHVLIWGTLEEMYALLELFPFGQIKRVFDQIKNRHSWRYAGLIPFLDLFLQAVERKETDRVVS